MRDRVTAVLQGHTPDCHPFIDRMELWYDVAEGMIALGGIEPYLTDHLIKEDADYRTAEYVATEIEKHRLNK
jgi:hypothetical protein